MPATKGPWEFDRKSGMVEAPNHKPLGNIVAFIHGGPHDEEACANGALIAGAPDMFKALEAMAGRFGGDRAIFDQALAALNKAKGASP